MEVGAEELFVDDIKDREGVEEKPIFPVAFGRLSGHDFICLFRDEAAGRLRPREFFDLPRGGSDEEEAGLSGSGYLLDFDGEAVWEEDDLENLPDAWLNRRKDGTVSSVKKQHQDKVPQKLYFDAGGAFSDTPQPGLPYEGWFVPAKLLLDPTTGLSYDSRTSEYTKLAKLGSEARSTSTSVLARTVVQGLQSEGAEGRKLLSFTDNRQDAPPSRPVTSTTSTRSSSSALPFTTP